jgi:hypothetical protein
MFYTTEKGTQEQKRSHKKVLHDRERYPRAKEVHKDVLYDRERYSRAKEVA